MGRTAKVTVFSVPPTVEVEPIANRERRAKSEISPSREQRDRDEMRWVMNLIQEAKAEQEMNPMTVEEILAESERFALDGEKRAKELGIKTDPRSIVRLIHERREARKLA